MEEEWRSIIGFSDYEVSDHGHVRRRVACHYPTGTVRYPAGYTIKLNPSGKGYLAVHLMANGKRQAKNVHVLVCEAFHGNRPSSRHQAAHSDGIPSNNTKENLRWALPSENSQDTIRHGRSLSGERNPMSSLTEYDIRIIRKFIDRGVPLTDIAFSFSVSIGTISLIKNKKSWK